MMRSQAGRARIAAAVMGVLASGMWMSAQAYDDDMDKDDDMPVHVEMFAPAKGDNVGIGGRGWFVDLALQYEAR
jgi:hypothetical protein